MICSALDHYPGEYPLEALPDGWANAIVTFKHRDGELCWRFEIINLKSNKRYLQEPMWLIAAKCFTLFFAVLPVYFLLYTMAQLVRLPFASIANLSLVLFCKEIWTVIRTPFYFVALDFAALYGVFKPLEGRVLLGEIESLLHDGKGRRQSESYQKIQRPFGALCWDFLVQKELKTTQFIAFCMQPIGRTDDPHIVNVDFRTPLDA